MLTQDYSLYTDEDQNVWSILFKRQLAVVGEVAYGHFKEGLAKLHFTAAGIPSFKTTNQLLEPLTGWQIYAVPGLIANEEFFEWMSLKKFGATTWLRKKEQLDYLEEPDMFHDVFGHVPLLADPLICDYLFTLAQTAKKYNYREEVVTAISRLYWYTIEFGLVKENDTIKIYGAGILSSPGETKYCLSDKANRVDFDLQKIIAYPYIIDSFQEQYYMLHSMHQLKAAVEALDEHLQIKYATA
ncbi:MAG: phenylalanine 4-monooxygenase [Agriterribacter sp.]